MAFVSGIKYDRYIQCASGLSQSVVFPSIFVSSNEQLATVTAQSTRNEGRWCNTIVLNVLARSEEKSDDSKDSFEKLKSHKSPGDDQIPAQLIKAVGRTILLGMICNKEMLCRHCFSTFL